MSGNNLYKKIAGLESKIDQYESEFENLNQMLIQCGFPQGIQTLKESMQDYLIIKEDPSIIHNKID